MAKIAWITGASTGIGRALALKLAEAGYVIAASARSASKLEELRAMNTNIHCFALDVTDKQEVRAISDAIIEKLGRIDLAVLNAGTYIKDNINNFNSEILRTNFDLNFLATIDCLDAVTIAMLRQNSGQIAIVSSVSGWVGLPYASAYGASKAALNNFAASLQPEMSKNNIDLKLICPGFVETPLTAKNDFEMPFIISAERAADEIIKGLNSKRFMIAFPKRMAFSMGLLSMLPTALRLFLTSKILRED